MPHSQESRIRRVFIEVYQLQPGTEREQHLERVCAGDTHLFRKVKKLLESFDSDRTNPLTEAVESFAPVANSLSQQVSNTAATPDSSLAQGDCVGNYEVIESIGEGGMGLVYRARQKPPVERDVALKLLKPGMNSEEMLARFHLEQTALARMDHPSIASVFDAGVTAWGQPYFIMELVDGIAIDEYCQQLRLSLLERLRLFQKVCIALHHAHEKAIVHRDIKPSNILVTTVDGIPLVKIIDFGIAKATEIATDQSTFTHFAQLLGTPLYMSPEMVALQPGKIDHRSDVYALGAVLCLLLTGTPPFDREAFRDAGFDGMRHMIREIEPTRPSRRKTRACGISGIIPDELDWIVLKAVEKDPDMRYSSALALSDDLERFLSHRPIEAAPPNLFTRTRKIVLRHPATSFVSVLSLIFVLCTTWLYIAKLDSERLRKQSEHNALAIVQGVQTASAANRERERVAMNQEEAFGLAQMLTALKERNLALMAAVQLPLQTNGSLLGESLPGDADNTQPASLRRLLLNLCRPRPVLTMQHPSTVADSCISTSRRLLASACDDGFVRLWNLDTAELQATLGPHVGPAQAVSFSPDGAYLCSGDREGVVKLWDVSTRTQLWDSGENETGVEALQWSPDGSVFAVSHRYFGVYVRDTQGAQVLFIPKQRLNPRYESLLFLDDSQHLLVVGQEQGIDMWNIQSGEKIRTLTTGPHAFPVRGISWLGDANETLLIGDDPQQLISILDFRTGWVSETIETGYSFAQEICSSPDGKHVACAYGGGKVAVYQVVTVGGKLTLDHEETFNAHAADERAVRAVEFETNTRLITSGEDGDVKVWEIRDVIPFQHTVIPKDISYVTTPSHRDILQLPVSHSSSPRANGVQTVPVAVRQATPHDHIVLEFAIPEEIWNWRSTNDQWGATGTAAFHLAHKVLAFSEANAVSLIDGSTVLARFAWEDNLEHIELLRWTHKGNRLILVSRNKTLVWEFSEDFQTKQNVSTWEQASAGIPQISLDDRWVFQCSATDAPSSRVVAQRDLDTGEIVREWPIYDIAEIALSGEDSLLGLSVRNGIVVYDLEANQRIFSNFNVTSVEEIRIVDSGRVLIAIHANFDISYWHIPTGMQLGTISPNEYLEYDFRQAMTLNFSLEQLLFAQFQGDSTHISKLRGVHSQP